MVCSLLLELETSERPMNKAESFLNWKPLHQSKWISNSSLRSSWKFVWTKLSIYRIHLCTKANMSSKSFCISAEDHISWFSWWFILQYQSLLDNVPLCMMILVEQSHFILGRKVKLPLQHKFLSVMAEDFESTHTTSHDIHHAPFSAELDPSQERQMCQSYVTCHSF